MSLRASDNLAATLSQSYETVHAHISPTAANPDLEKEPQFIN